MDHERLSELTRSLQSTLHCDQVVVTHYPLGEPDLDADDYLREVSGRLHRFLYTGPAYIFKLADFIVELSHPGDVQECQHSCVGLLHHVAMEAGDCVRTG